MAIARIKLDGSETRRWRGPTRPSPQSIPRRLAMIKLDEDGMQYWERNPSFLDRIMLDGGSSSESNEESSSESGFDNLTGMGLILATTNDLLAGDSLVCMNPSIGASFGSLQPSTCAFGGWNGLDVNSYCPPGRPLNWDSILWSAAISATVGLARYTGNPISFTVGVVGSVMGSFFYQMMQSSTSGPLGNIGELATP